jgi:hypothetical protein
MDAQTEAQVTEAIASAVSVPQTQPTQSAQAIIDAYIKNTSELKALAVKRIDETIERLKDLRVAIEDKCQRNLDGTIEIVRLVDDGFRDIKLIEQKGAKIEDAVLP